MQVYVLFGFNRDEDYGADQVDFLGVFATKEAMREAASTHAYYDGTRSECVPVEGLEEEPMRYNPNNPDTDW